MQNGDDTILEREAVTHVDVSSSVISCLDYHHRRDVLVITFNSGRVYEYSSVSEGEFRYLTGGGSVGREFNRSIRTKPCVRIG